MSNTDEFGNEIPAFPPAPSAASAGRALFAKRKERPKATGRIASGRALFEAGQPQSKQQKPKEN